MNNIFFKKIVLGLFLCLFIGACTTSISSGGNTDIDQKQPNKVDIINSEPRDNFDSGHPEGSSPDNDELPSEGKA